MSHRWLVAALIHCEKGFMRVIGYDAILEVIDNIELQLDGVSFF